MNLTNESYVILIDTKNFTERYYRDETGWGKDKRSGPKIPRDGGAGPEPPSSSSSRHQAERDPQGETLRGSEESSKRLSRFSVRH
jgi:hypothetical protein